MFRSPKATWKINRYGFWYGILFRLVDIIVYFNLAALSVSVRRVTACDGLRDVLYVVTRHAETDSAASFKWTILLTKRTNIFFRYTEISLRIPKSISVDFSVLKWKVEFWKVPQVPLELRDIKNIYFSVHSSYATQFVMVTTICLWEGAVCGVMYPLPHVRYDQAFLQIKTYRRVNSIRLGLILLCSRESFMTLPFLSERTEYFRCLNYE